jgi:lipopolysaccharide export system permease protein
MWTILDRYIARHVIGGIFIVLLVLVGLFTFFSFIEEVDDIGKASYGLQQAISYVLWQIPLQIYELFPTSALLGSLIALGTLANNSELTVMRAAGMSIIRIAFSVLKVGLLLTLFAMFIGETLAPYGEQQARVMRSLAQSDQDRMVFQTRYGFWARDGADFINIRAILPDGGFSDISLYRLQLDNLRPEMLIRARTAYYENKQWVLHDVTRTTFTETGVQREFLPHLAWTALLSPDLVRMVVIRPNKLSSAGLYSYIDYLRHSGQQTQRYELALWQRLSYPLVGITMILLAIPFVFGSLRSVTVGQRIMVGALLGIGFHMLNQAAANMGLVYHFPAFISALLPPILFIGLAFVLMRRVF